jgi:hypothetical protein
MCQAQNATAASNRRESIDEGEGETGGSIRVALAFCIQACAVLALILASVAPVAPTWRQKSAEQKASAQPTFFA